MSGVVVDRQSNAAVFRWKDRLLRIGFPSPSIVRVTCTDGKPFQQKPSRMVVTQEWADFSIEEQALSFVLQTAALKVVVDKDTGALSYFKTDGTLLLREPERGGKWLTPKAVHRNVFRKDADVAFAQSTDGIRAAATQYETVFDRMAFEAKLEFEFAEDEALFGLGSHEEGYGNLRGKSRQLYQQNMKAVIPYFVSTRGYGVLLDCCSLMTFHDDAQGSFWWADVVDELDFYVIAGDNFDAVTCGYHHLTGSVPLPPKWAFGYVQSKERYVNAAEMLEVVREYRRRRIPLDAIVLDWKSWPNGGAWGQKSLDSLRFPDPEQFADELHALGVHWMASIWPIMTGGCADQRELLAEDLMLGNQSTYNAFSPQARRVYWQQAETGLFRKGVDAWWCDCTEPFEADWAGAVKPDPDVRLAINTGESKLYIDPADINAYSLLHSQGIYEGQRSVTQDRRVLNLTRSSYAGQHRYGTVTWNGDICATWDVLRRSIPEGVNFCAAGEPYWTLDIGGFFIDSKPDLWFWRGDYSDGCRGLTAMDATEPDPADTGCRDLGYWELYTRWLQYAVFLPMFRSHGTDAPREIWRFGDEGIPFYDAIARFIRLRYQLMPYIYSLAAEITFHSGSMVRAVALEFPHDRETFDLVDQYLFGPALLVCPVTQPMYYDKQSQPIFNAEKSCEVYLPAGADWFDFWTAEVHSGGQTIIANAPLDIMPIFVRAGSIVPMTEVMQHVNELPNAAYELRVYTGCDAAFTLYEDAGDGYAYERGEFARIRIEWTEDMGELILHAREGEFPAMTRERDFLVALFSSSGRQTYNVYYAGEEIRLQSGKEWGR